MYQISVVNRSHTVPDSELHRVLRAVNRQIKEDFEPYWGFGGTLRLEGPAKGAIDTRSLRELRGDAILYLVDYGTADDVLGYHERNLHGVPYGFVYLDLCAQLGDPWSATLSHEALELIADPQANLLVLGPNPAAASPARVYHWFELCDAVQTQLYQIDEVTVSNFVLPSYYAPNDGARTNFMGTPLAPFKASPGGYIGYFEPGSEDARQFFGDANAARRFEIKNAAALPVGAQPGGRNQRRAKDGTEAATGTVARPRTGPAAEIRIPPRAPADPIRHVVVLMLENRSFDHVLGGLQGVIDGLDGVDPNAPGVNVDAAAGTPYKQEDIALDRVSHCFKVPHEYADVKRQLQNNGAHFVDSFVENNPNASPAECRQVMAYFKDGALPVTHALAKNYLVCDRWFSSLPGPTWPNRFFVHSGTSLGNVVMPCLNDAGSIGQLWGKFTQPTIYDRLDAAGVPWRIYHDGFPQSVVLDRLKGPFLDGRYSLMEDFIEDVKDEKNFPAYVFIEPRFLGGFLCKEDDQHPPTGMLDGERLVASVYNAIRSNPDLWRSTLLVLTYDEHGGFYDHVTPPDTIAPDDSESEFKFDQLGVRVPTILISPWLSAGCDHTQYDHTSILSYLIQKHGLQPLGARTDPQAGGSGMPGFAANFLKSPRADADVLPPFKADDVARRGAMAGREPFEPDESQRLLLALAEQMKRHDQTKGLGQTLPSGAPHAPAVIPSDAYRFARRIDDMDAWLRKRRESPAGAGAHARRHGGSAVHGMSAGPAVQPDGLKGIDVWAGNGQIDWHQVKASGIDFVYVRAAYGTHPDKFAVDYLNSARAAGLVCGVYQFLRTSEDYQAQLSVMLQQLAHLEVGKGDLPPALDVEDNPQFDGPWDPKSNGPYLAALTSWINAVRQKTGASPLLYTRKGFWDELGNPPGFAGCPLWVASYGRSAPLLPAAWPNYTFWQFSESGQVPGIAGAVDLNSFPGTLAQLQELRLK